MPQKQIWREGVFGRLQLLQNGMIRNLYTEITIFVRELSQSHRVAFVIFPWWAERAFELSKSNDPMIIFTSADFDGGSLQRQDCCLWESVRQTFRSALGNV